MYTILYDFMWRDLHLRGAEKEVFAVIYGFWKKDHVPVEVTVQTIQDITGLSRSSIISAKGKLLDRKLIAAYEIRGRPSRYAVLEPDTSGNETRQATDPPPVQIPDGHLSKNCTGTRPNFEPHNNNSNERNYKRKQNESLVVGNREDFDLPDKL